MRGDISGIFDIILFHLDEKINLLHDYRNIEYEIKHILAGNIEDKIIELINSGSELIEKIDICDYNISSRIDEIRNKTGVDPEAAAAERLVKSEVKISEFRVKKNKTAELLREISNLRTENLNKMESIALETSDSADELDRIDLIKKKFPKGLRSSWF